MEYRNKMNLKFLSLGENESFARLAVASFCSNVNFSIEDISDIKTAVSEGVTNAIVHAYDGNIGEVEIQCTIFDDFVEILIMDSGKGIENIDEAMKPFFTTKPDKERSGMGFTVMEGFMDKMEVKSEKDKGTCVTLIKKIKK